MKFLAGIEELQIKAQRDAGDGQQLILLWTASCRG
jgi:hypothetical protein